MTEITVSELNERLQKGETLNIIDVREPHEWAQQHLDGITKISLGTLPAKLPEIESWKDQEVIMVCRSGGRSGRATQFLAQQGFSGVKNLRGGMLAWKAEIDPTFDVQ